MRVLLALVIGIIVGAALLWYYNTHRNSPELRSATSRLESSAQSARDSLEARLRSFNLGTNDIRDELARTGRVVREKARAAGQAVADATADARITAAIKTKLMASREVPGFSISVNTTGGIVTLSGSVPTADAIGKAMVIALDTDGVRQVISTIQVKAQKAAQYFPAPRPAPVARLAAAACETRGTSVCA